MHYCQPGASGAWLAVSGSASFAANGGSGDFTLHASNLPASTTGVFLMGSGITQGFPFGLGYRCVAGPVYRLRAVSAAPGATSVSHTLDYLALTNASNLITPGSAWTFQFWFRAGGSFDSTDAAQVVFGPPEPVIGASSIASGNFSLHPLGWAIGGGIVLVQDSTRWNALWAAHDPAQAPAPFVDFTQDVVVGVFGGWRPTSGYSMQVTNLDLSVATLDVRTLEVAPGQNCNVLFVTTQPFEFVRLPRVEFLRLGAWYRDTFSQACF